MAVRIDEIRVKNLGPIQSFSQKLNLVNIFHGYNERGKTFIVEFIIRSLFRNPKNWYLREFNCEGNEISDNNCNFSQNIPGYDLFFLLGIASIILIVLNIKLPRKLIFTSH